MTRLALALLLPLAACAECYLEVAEGSADNRAGTVHPNDRVVFEAHLDDHVRSCGGLWLVNGFVGGNATFGTVDTCGVYLAPPSFPPNLLAVSLEATFPGRTASEGCESAYGTLTPAR